MSRLIETSDVGKLKVLLKSEGQGDAKGKETPSILASPQIQSYAGSDESADDSSNDQVMGLPPNGTFSLWQMLMAILKYERTNLVSNANLQASFAKNLGGLDGTTGIFEHLYNIGVEVGEKEAQGMILDATSKFIQAGISGGTVVASGIKYLASTRPALNEADAGLKDLGEMEKEMKESQAAITINKDEQPGAQEKPIDERTEARLNAFKQGSFDKFHSENEEEYQLNKKAAQHAANDEKTYDKVMKKIGEKKQSYENQKQRADTSRNTFVNTSQLVSGALEKATDGFSKTGLSGVFKAGQADVAKDKAKAQASKDVMSQAQQGISQMEQKSEQNAETALQEASQWATGFAQAAASQVHA